MKHYLIIFITLAFLGIVLLPSGIEAKVLPQAQKAVSKSVSNKSAGAGIGIYPRLRGDRKALLITFSNLQNANAVSYMLLYQTRGKDEGAGGSVRPNEGNTASRELLFGTCSKNVCTYHTNITNMKLEITTDLKSGKKSIKRYRIRV